ncbi:MAG TPA: YggS family pyridoxal phosphate-dependent enzyme [Actinomycetota bacterium]|nr:YggS family pyridoxal phosphate-dependent enzyme [Actinomycetota bacterium]
MTIATRLAAVRERVAAAARAAGRDPADITLVAVGKTFGVDVVSEAIDAGATDIGENRAQELRDKVAVLGARARWHFIGPLQSNKVRLVVGSHVVLIHSVDRFGVAEAIGRRAASLGFEQDVLVEVNVGGEATKHGVEPPRAVTLATEISQLPGVSVRGLMAIPPRGDDEARHHFQTLAALGHDVAAEIPGATELSMGMSHDFEVAIEEGATIVRVGQAIFGPRPLPKKR